APQPGFDSTEVVNFNPASGLGTNRSDYVAGLYLSPFAGVSLVAQGRFDERDLSLRRQDTALQATYGPLLAQAVYTFTKFDPRADPTAANQDLAFNQQEILGTLGLRLTDRWSMVGQVRYDIDSRERIQDILELKYADECFVLSVSYIETLVDN